MLRSVLRRCRVTGYVEEEVRAANAAATGYEILKTNMPGLGWGVVAKKDFEAGELVEGSGEVRFAQVRDAHSLQVGWEEHVQIGVMRFVNHNCDANIGIRDDGRGAYNFFARQAIRSGEVLTLDYETFEYESFTAEFSCLCGSPACRKHLRGFKHSGDAIRAAYGPYVAGYLSTTMHGPKSMNA